MVSHDHGDVLLYACFYFRLFVELRLSFCFKLPSPENLNPEATISNNHFLINRKFLFRYFPKRAAFQKNRPPENPQKARQIRPA